MMPLTSVIREHRNFALLVFLSVFAVVALIGVALPRRSVAATDVWLDRARAYQSRQAPLADTARLEKNDELEFLTSKALASQTVIALGLDRVPGFGQPREGSLLSADDAQRRAVAAVRERLSVEPIGDAYAVRIRFKADSNAIAASVANKLADLYVDDRRGTETDTKRQNQLAAVVEGTRYALVRSEAERDAYRSANPSPETAGQSISGRPDLGWINAELGKAQMAAAAARARETRAIDAATPRLRELDRRRAQRAVEDDQASPVIDKQIADQRRLLARIALPARAAEARVAALSRAREEASTMDTDAQRAESELAQLTAIAEEARAQNARAVAALDQARRADAQPRSTAYVISRSSARSARREPSFWLIICIALASATFAAGSVAFVRERNRKGFASAAALERDLNLRVLATIPDLSERRIVSPENRLAVPDYLVQHQHSQLAEAFRDLLLRLRENRSSDAPLVIAVSSALPEEGKTTVSLCLARAAALSGERTLLIDCDLRRPAASRALFPRLETGLVEVIEGHSELSAALRADPGSKAMVLGIASQRKSPMVALEAKAIKPLINRLHENFDVVVCDTPPALALSEAREIAALASRTVLVVRHRDTPKGAAKLAQDLLSRVGVNIAGAALTMVPAARP